jgi:transcriptional regulator with XRE-family HTH domain
MSVFVLFGEALRKAREEKGWSYIQAMMKINMLGEKDDKIICTDRSLLRWEKGQGLPKIEATKAMSIAYDAPELVNLRVDLIKFLKKRKSRLWWNTDDFYGQENIIY